MVLSVLVPEPQEAGKVGQLSQTLAGSSTPTLGPRVVPNESAVI